MKQLFTDSENSAFKQDTFKEIHDYTAPTNNIRKQITKVKDDKKHA